MDKETVDKIVEIFMAGQDKYELYAVQNLEHLEQWWLSLYKDGGGWTKWSFGYVNNEGIYGFLINRKYGFAEAWANQKYKNLSAIGIALKAEAFLQRFVLAVNKTVWLKENL